MEAGAGVFDDILRFFKRHPELVAVDGPLKPYEFDRLVHGDPLALLGGSVLRLRGFIEGYEVGAASK